MGQKAEQWLPKPGDREREVVRTKVIFKECSSFILGDEKIPEMMVVMNVKLHEYTKNH